MLEERRQRGLTGSQTSAEDNRNRHDIRSSLNSIKLLAHMIRNGYRFEDANAKENLASLEKAVECLEKALLESET